MPPAPSSSITLLPTFFRMVELCLQTQCTRLDTEDFSSARSKPFHFLPLSDLTRHSTFKKKRRGLVRCSSITLCTSTNEKMG